MKIKYSLPQTCQQCKTVFTDTYKRKFCSKKCYADFRRLPQKQCPWCNKIWQPGKGRPSKNNIFCSKACWYAWHKGANHQQHKERITIACDHCGKEFERLPHRVAKFKHNYCSEKCASIAHREKIKGSKNYNWKGGSLAARGPAWGRTRHEVLEEHGYKCAHCGMTNEEHKKQYKNITLHVHHSDPFRLSLENDKDKLIPLCIPCHMKAEAKLNKSLTKEQKEIMRQNTEIAEAKGLYRAIDLGVPCPSCDGFKAKKSETCRKCRTARIKEQNKKHYVCPDCGGYRSSKHRKRCWDCHLTQLRITRGNCIECGKKLKTIRAKRCPTCNARIQGKHSQGPYPIKR